MTTRGIPESDITSWVEMSIEKENFVSYEIVLAAKTERGDGYFGDIVFATVKGTTKENEKKVLDIVIKHGKNNALLRKVTKIKSAFETEIRFYDKIFPAFQRLQSVHDISDGLESIPKCYSTLVLEDMEVIVLENLRKQGYELPDRTKTLTTNHLKLVLKEYGKLHALSFALRDQNAEKFKSIAHNYGNPFESFLMDRNKIDAFDNNNTEALRLLRENGDEHLREQLEKVLVKKTVQVILDLDPDNEPQSVVLHGDCWSNNLMFKYQGDDKSSPSQVKILDYQISALRSPVFDLSYLLYANSSQKDLDRFEELLETYYASFSSFLRKLGSDPEKLFTYSDLKRHWKKYSIFGILFSATLFRFLFCKQEDAPAVETLVEGQDIGSFMSPEIDDEISYYQRLKIVYIHQFGYKFK